MKKIELLSPAGNFECLKAAINNGADAVYLGGSNFSARAFADNFDNEKIVEAINYAHLRNVKVYITLNTLLNEFEIENAYKQAKFYYEHNADALLVQDLGLFYRLRNDFPDFELHASTQMHIHNLSGVKNASKLGFKRVVLARESSLDLIKQCCKEDVEIEVFVHGAICVSYSGQCLMSSIVKNRSANKGMCAQCCRLKYHLYENNKIVDTDTDYLLSPKDMCLIDDIPDLIEAGVTSLKIEGRMKSSAYVGYITRLYREAIDSYYANNRFELSKSNLENIKVLYNRGFTNTYLKNDDSNLFGNTRPNHLGIEIGKVVRVKENSIFIRLSNNVNQFDGIRIASDNDFGFILNKIKVNDLLVSSAKKGEIIEVNSSEKCIIGSKVYKTLNFLLEKDINASKDKKLDLNLNIFAFANSPIMVKARILNYEFNYSSDICLDEAINKPILKENIIDSFNKTDSHPYYVNSISVDLNPCFISLKILNDIRRDFYDQLDTFILNTFKRNHYKQFNLSSINNSFHEFDLTHLNPTVNSKSTYYDDYNVVSEFGGILLDGYKDGYYSLNITNSYAYEFLLKLGFNNIVISVELDANMINELVKGLYSRNIIDTLPLVIVKGKRTLMNIKQNPFKKYISQKENIKISDGSNVYCVVFHDDYIELKESSDFELNIDGLTKVNKITI